MENLTALIQNHQQAAGDEALAVDEATLASQRLLKFMELMLAIGQENPDAAK